MSSYEKPRRGTGCVTNFNHGDLRLTIWDTGSQYRLSEFGVLGQTLPLTDDPVFQSVAKEVHRLAQNVGRLRRIALPGEAEKSQRIAEAAQQLVAAMDSALGPMWRANTLGVPENQGDEVNRAWDELVAAIEGGRRMSADRWSVKVVWLDGEEELLMHGDVVAAFSRERAEKWRDFMLEGVADEVQSINVVQAPRRAVKP